MFENIVSPLSEICTTDYSFITAALEIVQQIPYEAHETELYPLETMVENAGDCSDKSYVFASLLVAKGYYTILLCFELEDVGHMGVGVAASVFEVDYTAYYWEYEDRKYYYCECTSLNWKIGELPSEFEDESAYIVDVGGHREAQITTTINPHLADSDGDGLSDWLEGIYGTNSHKSDTDNDGLTDYFEIYTSLSDPLKADSDFDGLNDGTEIAAGTNPLVSDTDGDGLTDGKEVSLGTNPLKKDTDGDLWNDSIDIMPTNFFIPNFLLIAIAGGIVVTVVFARRRKRPAPVTVTPAALSAQCCPTCGSALAYAYQYQRWYCPRCQRYL